MPIFFDIFRQSIAFISSAVISGSSSSIPVDNVKAILNVTSDGQTLFALPQSLTISADLTKMFVNGVKVARSVDYLVTGTTLTWISTRFSLKTTDLVEFYYG